MDGLPGELAFDFAARTRIVAGAGSSARLGELVKSLGVARVLLVTDPGLVEAGHAGRLAAILRASGLELARFEDVDEDPDATCAARCAAAVREHAPEALVAVGGGSAIDVAKGGAMLVAGGGRMQDYWGSGKVASPLLPLVAVPTTAGTGSEVQSYALISDETTHQKMACGAADAAPRIAVLDPELTLTVPRTVTALTGLDALGHALETAVTNAANPLSELFSRAAFRYLAPSFAQVLAAPDDLAARASMQLGACWAGLAIEHSMLGAAHAIANPLSARYGLAHGLAVALALPVVVRFNALDPAARARYSERARDAGLCASGSDDGRALAALLDFLDASLRAAGIAPALGAHGVEAHAVPELAAGAARQWTAQFNPRSVTSADFEALLESALAAR